MQRLVVKERPLGREEMDQALDRIADGIVAQIGEPERLALVGIRRGGVPLAHRLAERLEARTGHRPELGVLDITLYRDDLLRGLDQPQVGPTEIDFRLSEKWVVLVDDVLYSGRTVRAAIDALMDFGRPRRVLLAVLVDRGGRELPIQPDAVGQVLEVDARGSVEVRLSETHGTDEVVVLGPEVQ